MIARIAGAMFFAAIVIALFLIGAIVAHAQDASAMRAQFFKDAKKAIFVGAKRGKDGKFRTFNCCEPGEANGVIITGANATHFRAKVVRHFRDKSRKIGSVVEIRKDRIVRWPVAPSDMGEVAFIAQHGGSFVYCFFPQAGG